MIIVCQKRTKENTPRRSGTEPIKCLNTEVAVKMEMIESAKYDYIKYQTQFDTIDVTLETLLVEQKQ